MKPIFGPKYLSEVYDDLVLLDYFCNVLHIIPVMNKEIIAPFV